MWQGAQTLQFNAQRRLQHFLSFEGFGLEDIKALFEKAKQHLDGPATPSLSGKTVGLLFFEPSTRTRASFELAAKRLGATTLALDIAYSSTTKGETLYDTIANLCAMRLELLVIRHPHSGAALLVANHFHQQTQVINAGDGRHAHPTQALLDAFTLFLHRPPLNTLKVAIVGDLLHSRVARSQLELLQLLQVPDIRLVGPKTLVPASFNNKLQGVSIHHDLKTGLDGVDAVLMLRLQKERMQESLLPEPKAYHRQFGLNADTLAYAAPDAIVLHPGPINRGIELSSEVADSHRSLLLTQVRYGVAVRMAVLESLLLAHALIN